MEYDTPHNYSVIDFPTQAETISFIAIFCIGIIGCFVAVLALGRETFVGKTSTLVIVASLTWVDLIGVLATSSFVFHGFVVGDGWIGKYPQCQIQAFCTTACCIASGSIVTFMAIDRGVSLYKPFFYKTAASPSLARTICIAILTACLLVGSLPFLGIGNYTLSRIGSYVCHVDLHSKERAFILILGLIATLVISLMLSSNVLVFFLVWKLKTNVCRVAPASDILNRKPKVKNSCLVAKKEHEMAQFVASVSLIFLLTWLPLTISLFCHYFQVSFNETVDLVVMKIAASGFIANPFTYVLFRRIFKRTLRKSLSRIQCGIGTKFLIKSKSNGVFHINVSRIQGNKTILEPSKVVTDVFDPNFVNYRSKTIEKMFK